MATKTVTAVGDAQIDTAQSKFGGASGLFDGVGDYLTIADDADFDFGAGNFTIDFWVRFNSVVSYKNLYHHNNSASDFFNIYWSTGNTLHVQFINSGSWRIDYTIPFTPSTGVWYHIELSKSGTAQADWHTFIDGVEGTKSIVNGLGWGDTLKNWTSDVHLGHQITGGGDMNGWFDEFRVSKGVARHTAGFTPSVSAYSTDTDTKLLLHFDGADASTSFLDSSVAAAVNSNFFQFM